MIFQNTKPIYLQIADAIFEEILLKKWQPNERIPSVREMAINLEVNPNTVQRSYSYLQDENIIYMKRGIGYFISEDAYSHSLELKKNDFIAHVCPQLFKTMKLLNIKFEELKHLSETSKDK